MSLEKISSNRSFSGEHAQYTHQSDVLGCQMRFAVYLPPIALTGATVPVLYWLSGLTCTDENFMQKAGAHRIAAELGIALVAPDTSPRGEAIPDDPEGAYDFGLGAGFYLNATQEPWAANYRMYDYIVDELPNLIEPEVGLGPTRSIAGHSMGGHGALTIGLKNPDRYEAISAFSPICNPINTPWGRKAFYNYLGEDMAAWQDYDASELLRKAAPDAIPPILVDQGTADNFLEKELSTQSLITASMASGAGVEVRMQPGYDHSYYFIASFIEDHLWFHEERLKGG